MFALLRPSFWRSQRGPTVTARLYTRPGCGLCDEALDLLAPFERRKRLALEVIDIETDPALLRRYLLRIPVLEIEGRAPLEWPFGRTELGRILS